MNGLELILSVVCLNLTQQFNNHGGWNPLSLSKQKYLEWKNKINGRHLRVGTINNFPFNYVTDMGNGAGMAFDIFDVIAEKLNFTYEIVVPEDNFEGSPNKIEKTLFGLVLSEKVDVAVSLVMEFEVSKNSIQYSTPFNTGDWIMMLKRPQGSAAGSGIFAPFAGDVWYITIVAVFIYGPVIWIITKIRSCYYRDNENHIELPECFWFVYSAFIKQGTNLAPEAISTRILFATWWLFIILLSAFYTANLTAFLTLSKFTLEINRPEDLVKKNAKWFANEGGTMEFLVSNPFETLHYLSTMVQNGYGKFETIHKNEVLSKVSSGYIYIGEEIKIDLMLYEDYLNKSKIGIDEQSRCTYVTTTDPVVQKKRSFAFPLNSELKHVFDKVLNNLIEAGIADGLMSNGLPPTKICPLDLQSKERRLQNTDLMTTYLLGLIGIATASSVFICELFFRRCRRNDKHIHDSKIIIGDGIHNNKDDWSKPPSYDSLYNMNCPYDSKTIAKKKYINGRYYWVVKTKQGDVRLIPLRTPSALLFEIKYNQK